MEAGTLTPRRPADAPAGTSGTPSRPMQLLQVAQAIGSSLTVNGLGSSAVEVAAAPPPVDLGPELALELHQAPDLGAVGAEVGFDVGGRLADGGQVEAEQLRAPLQRRRDRPAHVQGVPSPHRTSVSNTSSRGDQQRCVVQQGRSEPGWAALGPQLGRTWGTAEDSRRQQT